MVIILVCFGALGYAGWKFWGPAAAASRLEVLPRDPEDSVKASWGSWTIYGGMGQVVVAPKRGGDAKAPDYKLTFDFARDYLTPEQKAVLEAVREIVDKNPAKWKALLGLTSEQFAALEAVRRRNDEGKQLDPSDEQRLKALFAEYEPLAKAARKAEDKAEKERAEKEKTAGGSNPTPAKGGRGPGQGAGRPAALATPEGKAAREAEEKLCDAVEDVVRKKVPAAAPRRRRTRRRRQGGPHRRAVEEVRAGSAEVRPAARRRRRRSDERRNPDTDSMTE